MVAEEGGCRFLGMRLLDLLAAVSTTTRCFHGMLESSLIALTIPNAADDHRPSSRQIRPAKVQHNDESEGSHPAATSPTPGLKTKAQRAAELAAREAPPGGASGEDEGPFARAPGGGASGGKADASLLAGVEGLADLPAPEALSAAALKDAGTDPPS
jgi:hypothetical protein